MFSDVRGRGLMLGAVLGEDFAGQAGAILDHAAEQGLLTLQAGPDVLRFVPSLNITDEEVAEGLKRLLANAVFWTTKRDAETMRRPAKESP